MLNGQDVVVLLNLAAHDGEWTVRSLENDLGISRASIHRSLRRLDASGLYDLVRRRTNLSQTEEFLIHAVKYLLPAEMKGEPRGIPTAWAAAPLASQLAPQSDLPRVWPDPRGKQRGIALEPLHPTVPSLARPTPTSPNNWRWSMRSESATRVPGLPPLLLVPRLFHGPRCRLPPPTTKPPMPWATSLVGEARSNLGPPGHPPDAGHPARQRSVNRKSPG
jgi:hypothetical protein